MVERNSLVFLFRLHRGETSDSHHCLLHRWFAVIVSAQDRRRTLLYSVLDVGLGNDLCVGRRKVYALLHSGTSRGPDYRGYRDSVHRPMDWGTIAFVVRQ